MKQMIVMCVFWCSCLGCDNVQKPVDVQEPIDVNVKVDVVHPIAKLAKTIPSTHEIVCTGDTITLIFTEAPENLKISALNLLRLEENIGDARNAEFSISSLEYNGDTTPTFVITVRNYPPWRSEYPVRVVVQWTHGYQALVFDVKIAALQP